MGSVGEKAERSVSDHYVKIVLKIMFKLMNSDIGKSRLAQHLYGQFLSPHSSESGTALSA